MNNMSVSANSMLMQMAQMRMQAHNTVDNIQGNFVNQAQGVNTDSLTNKVEFGDMLKNALNEVNGLQLKSNELKTNFELGDRSVSLAEVMITGQKAGLALEATVQVRNKMVEAYKTIMQMQI